MIFFLPFFKKKMVFWYSWSTLMWHRCYYPHRSRDALSPHSFVRNIFIISYYATSFKVRKWLDHFGWWKNSEKFVCKYFQLKKNNNFISISGRFLLLFSIHFLIGPISYQKTYFKILDVYISVKRALEKLHLHPQWGPDTQNRPHQRGAVSKAEQPIFVQKKTF